jgi:AcrR family transcriptional regulator
MTAAERRRRIVDAAVERFAEGGYPGTSMDAIAAAAGITKPVLYDHFSSKRDLYIGLMEEISGELRDRSAEAMALEAPLEARVRMAIEAFFAYAEERPAAARVLLVIPRGEPELRPAWDEVQRGVTESLAALFVAEPGLLAGAPDRKRRLALFVEYIKKGNHGLIEWWERHPDTPRELLVDTVMDVAWTGLRGHQAGRPSSAR